MYIVCGSIPLGAVYVSLRIYCAGRFSPNLSTFLEICLDLIVVTSVDWKRSETPSILSFSTAYFLNQDASFRDFHVCY